jgi:hypothetical protein
MPFKWLGDRIKKGVRDIGSGAKDVLRNNPEMLAIAGALVGLPYLQEKGLKVPGGDLVTKAIGSLSKTVGEGTADYGTIEGTGILGTGQKILQNLVSGSKEGNSGILGLIASFLMKKELEKEKQRALEAGREGDFDLANKKFGSQFGIGENPKAEWVFKDMQYDPSTGKRYDFHDDYAGYQDYITDSEGRITNYKKDGGIAQLKMGGTGNPMPIPFNPNNKIAGRLTLPQPVLQRARGGVTEIFDPRMSGNQMMNQIKKNPGITDFFPPQFGHIEGPGGPKDDKIPAMLSDGEFVMTAKAVDNAGGPKAMYGLMNRLDPDSSQGRGIV